MVHDPHHSSAKRHARNPYGNYPGYRTYRRRVRGPAVHIRKRLKNLFGKVLEPGGTLTIQLYLFMQRANYDEAFAVAVVLLVIVLAINGLAKFLSHKFDVEKNA